MNLESAQRRIAARFELARREKLKPWRALPGPQQAVIDSPAFEVLYGGAAGGGKTCLLVNLARQFPASLLIRRTYPELEDSLILESRQWYGDIRAYNSTKHIWTWGNRRVRFGHMERDDDMFQYQSAQFAFIGVDELTQLNRLPYEYLISRVRSTVPGQRCRMVASSNPGGAGHSWVKERWAPWLDDKYPRPAAPGELRWFRRRADNREEETTPDDPDALSRTFIPAKLKDNPYLGQEYRRQLSLLPEPIRTQLLEGDWAAGEQDDADQVIPTSWVREAMARWVPGEDGELDAIGCDVAHGGDDRTCLAFRRGARVSRIDTYPGSSTPDGQSVVALLALGLAAGGWAYIDAMPPSALDIATGLGMRVQGVNFGAGSVARDKSGQFGFMNMRAELFWRLREALAPEAETPLALPQDPELMQELTAARWSVQVSGIKIEPKDDIKKRLGRSPDKADAVALAVWGGGMSNREFMW